MLSYAVDTITGVNLGQQGEHLVQTIRIDVSPWLEIEPELGVHIVATRHGETVPYIAATTLEGTELVWPVTSYDTGVVGAGKAAVIGAYDSQIKKSRTFRTITGDIVPGSDEDETPEPYTGWLDQIIAAGQDVLSTECRVNGAVGTIYEATGTTSQQEVKELELSAAFNAGDTVTFAVIVTGSNDLISVNVRWDEAGTELSEDEYPDGFTWTHTKTLVGAMTQARALIAVRGAASIRFAVASGAERKHLLDDVKVREAEAHASRAASSENAATASATAAAASATAAATSAANAATSETNAAHYADVAQQGAEESGFVFFDVHDDDGHMYVTVTDSIGDDASFAINESTGHLEVTING